MNHGSQHSFDVDHLLQNVEAALGVHGLTFDDDLSCYFEIENGIEISLTYFPDVASLLMVTPIVSVEGIGSEVLEIALGQNLDWASNGDGIYSIPPGSSHLCFSRLFDASNGSVELFRQEIVAFAQAVMEVTPFFQNQQHQSANVGEFMPTVSPFV